MKERFIFKETNVLIIADEKEYIEAAKEEILRQRRNLEAFIKEDPFFLVTLEPYKLDSSRERRAPEIVRRMIKATLEFDVGPMAAVAGTLAELAVEAMCERGATYAIVENGGDIALINDRPVTVGIFAGEHSPFSGKIALKIEPQHEILGVCTSSATVGHSISFGAADAATVIARGGALADAAATALCNAVKDEASVKAAFSVVSGVEGVEAALIIYKDIMATWGDMPEVLTNVASNFALTSRTGH